MPQSGAGAAGAAKKKKKGRPPAHQNVFAFRHNPKSTKTAAILAAPIRHCCRRCHDKLVWRKNYRKYKPLTQASTCNICRQRNVTAAYHTICTKCTVSSPTALNLLRTWNESGSPAPEEDVQEDGENVTLDDDNDVDAENDAVHECDDLADVAITVGYFVRVCAVCVKQPALPDEDDESEGDWGNTVLNPDGTRRPLKLRELKSLRRQREKALQKPRKVKVDETNDEESDEDEDEESDEDEDEDENEGDDSEEEDETDDDEPAKAPVASSLVDDDDDPFLRAVGGATNLLTGEAYQQMLLKTGKVKLLPQLGQSME